jgi:hypothetical protein
VLIPGNLKLFRMNTYEKYRGEGGLIVNYASDKDAYPACPEPLGDRAQRVCYIKLSGSISTSTAVCGISLASQYAMAPLSSFVSTDRFGDLSRN